MLRHLVLALLTLTSTVAIAASNIVATVNGRNITVEEFNRRYNEMKRSTPLNLPTKKIFLEDLIRYEIGIQEAEKVGMQNDPIVKERVRQELYKALVEKSIGEKVNSIKVSEDEMKKYYTQFPDIKSSHILIEVKPEANPHEKQIAHKRALEILQEIKKSKRDFAEQAKLYSDDVLSKNRGGDLDYQNRVTIMVPFYYDAIVKARVGDIVGPVETKLGFHIIKVTGRRTYNEVTNKKYIRTGVFDEKRKDIFNAYFKSLKSKYKIEINQALLKGLKDG